MNYIGDREEVESGLYLGGVLHAPSVLVSIMTHGIKPYVSSHPKSELSDDDASVLCVIVSALSFTLQGEFAFSFSLFPEVTV